MPNLWVGPGRDTDIFFRVLACSMVMAALAACQPVNLDVGPVGPIDPPATRQPRLTPMVAGASAVDVASVFEDRAPQLAIVHAGRLTATPGDGSQSFTAMIWLSEQGTIVGSAIDGRPDCPKSLVVAGSGRTLSVPTQYPRIQAAVDAAQAGDTVYVQSGTYHERVRMRSDVSLVGAGATTTIIDGGGQAITLIDYTDAQNAVVRGFTLTGVGMSTPGCARPGEPWVCGGVYYASAIYGDGHNGVEPYASGDSCADTTILVTQNIIRDNFIGMMAYFHARAVVRNNVFVGNQFGFVADHMASDNALLLNNTFLDNEELTIMSQAAYLDIIGNIVVGSQIGVGHEYVQTGQTSCNAFANVVDAFRNLGAGSGERTRIDVNSNLTFAQALIDPTTGDLRPTSEVVDALAPCVSKGSELTPWSLAEPGAFGGTLGRWP
jgi:hypothetical protein